jgi:Na+-driven multidrug efflux pump
LSAIGLISPFFFISDFIASIINSGTLTNYSHEIGIFNKKKANEFFSEGVISSICSALIVTSFFLLIRPVFIRSLNISPQVITYLNQYYNIILFYFFISPVSYVLENIVVANNRILINIAEWSYNVAITEFCLRMYKCHRTYLIHLF